MNKILAIGAHPDDIEFGCGGILIKEVQKGTQVKNVVCSLGEAGSNGTPEGRKQESEKAAKLIGADIEFLDMGGDCHILNSPENGIKIAEIIRTFKPNIILAPLLTENQHPDHSAVARMARDASRFARYGGLTELKALPVHKIGAIYYYRSAVDFESPPYIVVDISKAFDKWQETMKCHDSQMKTTAYLDLVNSRAWALGKSIGTDYALALWSNDPIHLDHISDLNLSSRNY